MVSGLAQKLANQRQESSIRFEVAIRMLAHPSCHPNCPCIRLRLALELAAVSRRPGKRYQVPAVCLAVQRVPSTCFGEAPSACLSGQLALSTWRMAGLWWAGKTEMVLAAAFRRAKLMAIAAQSY
jgi:hypothetical protein